MQVRNSEVSDSIAFAIPGPPVTWKRVNIVNGRAMTDKTARLRKDVVALAAASVRRWPVDKESRFAVSIHVTEKDGHRGDLDNYGKLVLDALNRIIWHDDRQVDHVEIVRTPPDAERPRTAVRVTRVTP